MMPFRMGLAQGTWKFLLRDAGRRIVSERFFREVFSDWKPSEAYMESCLSKALRPKPGPVIPQGFN